ncbi:hypothetical protein OIY81_1198 [Cryptosporidium canis]|uniref:Uncharacterized protein n=1 Tax=Cryptosporidium canis TaxID=195482 RepID=A0ABQ8P6A1_9CRYT|nr:hypothetical protein OJ252_2434 [Cryptosporidium canis]KAJ1612665.1 hypothetical protein OIY81_1198 [Cryptosporidium canis]
MLTKTTNSAIDTKCTGRDELRGIDSVDIEDNSSEYSMNIDSYKTATAMSNYFSSMDASEIVSNFQFSHTIESIIESEL